MHGFRLLFVASTTSNLGDGVLLVALPLLARDLSDDPLAVASVTVAATAPWLVFGLVAGVVVDRVDRGRLMVAADLVRAAILLGVALLVAGDAMPLAALLVAVFVLGVGETLFDTASQAVLPAVVPATELESANGRLFGAQLAANSFVGPPLGAALFATSASLPFAVDSATFVGSAALIALLVRGIAMPPRATVTTSIGADIAEGWRWLWRDAGVRAFALGAAVINVAHTGVTAIAVLFVRDELGVSEAGFGLTLSGIAIGGVVGSLGASRAVSLLGRRRAVLVAVGTFAGSLVVAGAATNPVVLAVALGVFGAAGEVWNVVAVSYRQARVPEHLLGRVMATYRVIAYGAMPTGAALGGAVAAVAGLRAPFFAGAALVAALLAYFIRATRALS